MENQQTHFEEAVELLKDGGEVTLECGQYEYEISPSENWIGGDVGDGYISQVLGNVIYSSAKTVLKESIKCLSEGGKEVKIII